MGCSINIYRYSLPASEDVGGEILPGNMDLLPIIDVNFLHEF